MTPQEVTKLLSLLTLASNILVLLFLSLFLLRKIKIIRKYWKNLSILISEKSTLLAFIVAFISMSGSLYFSEVALYEPCKLCWFQRIFMYPQVFILGAALYYKIKDIWKVELPLIVVGLIISGYHYYLQLNPDQLAPCGTVGFSVSCSERFATHFGYITIPWMSFSAFVMVFVLMLTAKYSSKKV